MASEIPNTQKTPHESFSFYAQSYRVGSNKPLPVKRPSIRVKEPKRLIVPLTRREVVLFFESLRTWRDLAIVSLMLFCGLRSREVLNIIIKNMNLTQKDVRVRGKGNKYRVLPIASYAQSTIRSYLTLERPETDHDILFVNLKGKTRGRPMTPQGLRGIFRYHRKCSGIENANAHRFRHTFASDMVMSGVSLPVLMRLMGHSDIQMTMRYVNLSAEDVRQEFERAVRRQMGNISDEKSFPQNP